MYANHLDPAVTARLEINVDLDFPALRGPGDAGEDRIALTNAIEGLAASASAIVDAIAKVARATAVAGGNTSP